MARVGQFLLVTCVGAAVLGGLGKMAYDLKRLGNQPIRPRQPWEYGPR